MATIEERLDRLEAIQEIKDLKARYFLACDQKRHEDVRDCFAEGEVVIEYGRIGSFSHRDDMVEVFQRLACQEHMVEMHHAQNSQITIHSADTASAVWGLYYYLIDTKHKTCTQLGGSYDDEYIRVEGRWQISKTVYHLTSTQVMDISDGLVKVLFAGIEAPAEIDDPQAQAG